MVSHMFFPLVTTINYSAPICFIIKYRFKEKVLLYLNLDIFYSLWGEKCKSYKL